MTVAHSITSSARASSVRGTSRPSALAVLRLITSSNLVGCTHRQIGRLLALEDPTDIDAGLAISIRATRSVAEQATNFGIFVIRVARWNSMACAKLNEFVTIAEEQRISAYEKRGDPVSCDGGEGIVNMFFVACIQNREFARRTPVRLPGR